MPLPLASAHHFFWNFFFAFFIVPEVIIVRKVTPTPLTSLMLFRISMTLSFNRWGHRTMPALCSKTVSHTSSLRMSRGRALWMAWMTSPRLNSLGASIINAMYLWRPTRSLTVIKLADAPM